VEASFFSSSLKSVLSSNTLLLGTSSSLPGLRILPIRRSRGGSSSVFLAPALLLLEAAFGSEAGSAGLLAFGGGVTGSLNRLPCVGSGFGDCEAVPAAEDEVWGFVSFVVVLEPESISSTTVRSAFIWRVVRN